MSNFNFSFPGMRNWKVLRVLTHYLVTFERHSITELPEPELEMESTAFREVTLLAAEIFQMHSMNKRDMLSQKMAIFLIQIPSNFLPNLESHSPK